MKKISNYFGRFFTIVLLCLWTASAWAEAVQIGGIYYNLIEKDAIAEVTSSPNSYSGKIVIPSSVIYEGYSYRVTTIGKDAFRNCSGLTAVTCLAENVLITDSDAFDETPIGSVTLYVPAASIAAYQAAEPWSGFGTFVSVVSGSCGENVSYTFEENTGTLAILGMGAMSNYFDISSIPWYSYRDKIKKVVVNDGVTRIGNAAFSGCSGLTSIDIPNSVTSIVGSAFSGCSGLTSIVIPNSVTFIVGSAFSGCSGMISIRVESGNTKYDSRDNCNAIIETSSNTLIAGCKTTAILNSVTSIGACAFSGCSGLTSIDIPNSVTSIGDGAFGSCSGLTTIDIPNSVTSIGDGAFSGCRGLTSINIPNSVTSIVGGVLDDCSALISINVESGNTKYDSRDNCNAIIETSSNTLIAGCKNTTIPNSVTGIGDWAFNGCSGLTSIQIPNSVTSIGVQTFWDCCGLTSIDIPNSVTSIGSSAFYGCSGLTTISIGSGIKKIYGQAFASCKNVTDVYCHAANVPETSSSAFENSIFELATLHVPESAISSYREVAPWSGFKTITDLSNAGSGESSAPSGTAEINGIYYTLIGKSTVAEVTSSPNKYSGEIVIPSSVSYEGYSYRVTSIGKDAFRECLGLKSVAIPNSVTSIANDAFHNCSGLTSVTIPNSVTSIGSSAFWCCI